MPPNRRRQGREHDSFSVVRETHCSAWATWTHNGQGNPKRIAAALALPGGTAANGKGNILAASVDTGGRMGTVRRSIDLTPT